VNVGENSVEAETSCETLTCSTSHHVRICREADGWHVMAKSDTCHFYYYHGSQ
jgi:hypothetical protein